MKQLKVESSKSQKILKVMQELTEQEFAKKRQDATKMFVQAITYYPEKKVLVASDAIMMVIWKVNDFNLLKVLSTAKKVVHFIYSNGMLTQVAKPDKLEVLDYKKVIPNCNAYVKLEDLDVKAMKESGVTNMDVLLEYSCICSQSRFKPVNFERASAMADFNIIEFIKSEHEKPVMLKSNKSKLICLIMPLREDKIKIHMK